MNDEPLTVDEIAERWRVSRGTIQKLIHQGSFPNAWRAGNKIWRIPAYDVENWEQQQRVASRENS